MRSFLGGKEVIMVNVSFWRYVASNARVINEC
jgi:hypothetical protein